jgi:hypothetical protein
MQSKHNSPRWDYPSGTSGDDISFVLLLLHDSIHPHSLQVPAIVTISLPDIRETPLQMAT